MSTVLPLYHNGSRRQLYKPYRSPLKSKETTLIFLLLVMFICAWVGLLSYMPEIQAKDSDSFKNAYDKFHSRVPLSSFSNMDGLDVETQPLDRNTLLTAHGNNPSTHENNPSQLATRGNDPSQLTTRGNDPSQLTTRGSDPSAREDNPSHLTPMATSRGTQSKDINDHRKATVKEMIRHAWDGYVKYAFGENEVKPITKKGHSAVVFGKTKVGATLVDSLDTLYIAGLYDEFNVAKRWVESQFSINEIDSYISFFEFNIRFIGGFLSAYALSGDKIFKDKAVELADKLMPAFDTNTGIPMSLINVRSGQKKNWGWASGKCSILSEIGTLQLEYQYLSVLTQNPIYLQKVLHIRELLKQSSSDSLYPNFIHPNTGRWGTKHISLGALGDSFYEYLLKAWLITNKKDLVAQEMFYNAIDALEGKLLKYVRNGELLMVSDLKNGRFEGKMQHLACFSGGMYALASIHATNGKSQHYMDIAKLITKTCHHSYNTTAIGLGPESFRMDNNGKISSKTNEKMYLLRPETVESYFYLWRLTHDPMYREWGWEAVKALESHCKVPSGGYTGIKDVYSSSSSKDDVQQSFFIAETLKYLYLLFSDDTDIPLDKWIFNTEAHPLPLLSTFPDSQHLNRTMVL